MNDTDDTLQAAAPDHSTVAKVLYDLLGRYHLTLNGAVDHAPFFGSDDEDDDLPAGVRCDDGAKKEFVEDALRSINRLIEQDRVERDIDSRISELEKLKRRDQQHYLRDSRLGATCIAKHEVVERLVELKKQRKDSKEEDDDIENYPHTDPFDV